MKKIGIIGAGSWGIALAALLEGNGHDVTVWSKFEDEVNMLKENHEHVTKLPGVKLADSVKYTTDLKGTIDYCDILVMAVPSQFTRSTAHMMKDLVKDGQIIVNVSKGIEDVTYKTLSEIIEEEIPNAEVAVMCGPSHAEEVGRKIPTTIVVGSHKRSVAETLQNVFMNDVFRVYTSPDVLGMEVGSALKNVIALAAGMCDGLGYGDNSKAALITRGIAEISRLGIAMGGKSETFFGLTGIGDLIVTCQSKHSRNRKAGELIGQGKSMQEAMDEVKMVVEGVYSTKAAIGLARKYNVELPIIEQVNAILFEGKDARCAVNELMLRDKKIEIECSFPEHSNDR